MANKLQIKRTNVAGRTPNVTSNSDSTYIDAGEFALNMADRILYTSNGSVLIPVGANNVDIKATNTISVSANLYANASGYFIGNSTQNCYVNSTGVYVNGSVISGGGGVNLAAQYAWTNTHTWGNSTVNSVVNSTALNVGTSLVVNSSILSYVATGGSPLTTNINNFGVYVGANVSLAYDGVYVGNATVQTQLRNTNIYLYGSSGNLIISSGSISMGSNVLINTTAYVVGNSTVNAFVNSTTAFFGNSTQNCYVNSTGVYVNGSVLSGGGSVNLASSYVWTNVHSWTNATANVFTINANGNIGVGTATPNATLDVVGTVSTAKANVLSQTLTAGNTTVATNWDTSKGQVATLFLTSNTTMAAPTNLKIGTYILTMYQDVPGNRNITSWASVFKWPGSISPTQTTTGNARDIYSFICDGTNLYGTFILDVK